MVALPSCTAEDYAGWGWVGGNLAALERCPNPRCAPSCRRARVRRLDHQRRRRAAVGSRAAVLGAVGGAGTGIAVHDVRRRRCAGWRRARGSDPRLRPAQRVRRRGVRGRLPVHRGQRRAGAGLGRRSFRGAFRAGARLFVSAVRSRAHGDRAARPGSAAGGLQGGRAERRRGAGRGPSRGAGGRPARVQSAEFRDGRSRAPHGARADRDRRAGSGRARARRRAGDGAPVVARVLRDQSGRPAPRGRDVRVPLFEGVATGGPDRRAGGVTSPGEINRSI